MSRSSSKPFALPAEEKARFVKTGEIRQRVRGREIDVLGAIGVPWSNSRGTHINCPFPDHPGDPTNDWRWDEKRARSYCTCAKGEDIFGVVGKCEGLPSFDDQKLRVAELLGASDLIMERAPRDPGRMQTTATALLSPPPDNRDDELVRAYLASRLRIDPADVSMPTTKFVGIERLSYVEAKRSPGKEIAFDTIGTYPCAVFKMVGPDGRSHAHRIYLGERGVGKADIPKDKKGEPRDAKKSASKASGVESTAGLSVLWGDPETAKTTIVTEGIETGAAVAYSLAAKVAEGTLVVAAAISAGGLQAFEPWPACDLVVAAADRDEAGKNGRPPSRAGERAARKLGMRLADRIRVKIALPGSTGQTLDWLDVMNEYGEVAVAEGLRAATPFVPTQAEIDEKQTAHERKSEAERAAEMYPLPELDLISLHYGHTATGKLRVLRIEADDKGSVTTLPVCSPFGVLARLRQLDKEDTYGLRLVVQGMNGAPQTIDVERSGTMARGGDELRAQLAAAGLRTEGDGHLTVISVLRGADPEKEIAVVSRPGWHHIESIPTPMFMTPSGVAIGAPANSTVELAISARMSPAVATGGTLEGWKKAATLAATTPGCEHWTIGLLAGFAGVLVDLTAIDTCGIDFTGMSSAGKSTAQRIATSAWCVPDGTRDKSLFQSARSTDNALEAAATRSTGTVLSLDEMAHVRGKDVAKIIYMIAGGAGKARMNASAGVRPVHTWRTFAVLSGEQALEEKVTSDGGEWFAGMSVRILDVDVTGVNRRVDAERLRQIGGVRANYGHAGPAFVEHLVKTGLHKKASEVRERIMRVGEALAGDADAATVRAATPLAVLQVAGELAREAGLICPEVNVQRAIGWAWGRFQTSTNAEALDPDAQATNNLRTWIVSRWNVSIKHVTPGAGGNPSREAEGWYDSDAVYIPKGALREAAGNVMKEQALAEMLERTQGLHRRKDATRRYIQYIPGGLRINAYALSRQSFGLGAFMEDRELAPVVAINGPADPYRGDLDDDLPWGA
ncbi:DUF927 domain-containing protein [Methylopila sp. 73B]|uniref:DUF927 domain-containing protein n=1 Tax=Methylopila sp. 73B TaxID=1120792 RepID=UPI0003A6542C|nr:DUF927 domain-containing protein [Methylopila sp. 73B]